jgi:hypothetical protein
VSTNEAPATAQTKPELSMFGRERPEPGLYNLDLSTVATLPLTDNGQPSTFADIYRKLRDAKILKVPEWVMGQATFETDAGEVTVSYESGQSYVSGQLHAITVLRDLIDLHKNGVDPHRATYFYYEHDWSRDADELYAFFVVHDGKIVRERFSFMPEYPRVLTKHEDDAPIWHSDRYGQQAWETYWYRKFYMETLTGQLMVLRPDEPTLYRYDRAVHDVTRDVEFVTLIKIYRLLWVAVALLAAIVLPVLRPYMAVVAMVAMADLLWKIWVTRKIGR